ncbi:hypothetical protein OHT77_14750 [Streptomyces sp. NBC_00252]|uniref:hypothetical protein n=1 Tax=Streptomyces sp. NBC_00252 TaxID=2975691 RepID=UPI002E29EC13|nr:hypothetical protein [Streptomyces sp. NBC_00252]
MSAHLIAMRWAAQGCPASTDGSALQADQSHESDRYVPPAEDGGIVDVLTSVQMTLVLLVGLIAVVLLVFQLWAGRRGARGEEEDSQ